MIKILKSFENFSREELENVINVINEYIVSCLHAERNRRIMKNRLINGDSISEIARNEKLSEQTIQKIVIKNEQIIFNKLKCSWFKTSLMLKEKASAFSFFIIKEQKWNKKIVVTL